MMRKIVSSFILIAFLISSFRPSYAQINLAEKLLPAPGVMVHLSPDFTPANLKGIIIHPENAFRFDFIIDRGNQFKTEDQGSAIKAGETSPRQGLGGPETIDQKKDEYSKLIKYFLASLAVPDENQWVNLSPYEKDRIIKEDFGQTEMGRDLLAQDYILKQITASLIYPKDELGKKFWDKVYAQAQAQFGSTNIPVNTFNKVWIVPDSAEIYEKGNVAYVLKHHLKVMLEEDYLSLDKNHIRYNAKENERTSEGEKVKIDLPFQLSSQKADKTAKYPNQHQANDSLHSIASQIVREIVIPELEREINQGENFANLRQIYSGMLLAAWYKRALKESLLAKIYADKNKLAGLSSLNILVGDPATSVLDARQNHSGMTSDVEAIYQRYLQAYKKGVFNYIQEDIDSYTKKPISRKYFSGGMQTPGMFYDKAVVVTKTLDSAQVSDLALAARHYDLAQIFVEPKDQAQNNNYPSQSFSKHVSKTSDQGNPDTAMAADDQADSREGLIIDVSGQYVQWENPLKEITELLDPDPKNSKFSDAELKLKLSMENLLLRDVLGEGPFIFLEEMYERFIVKQEKMDDASRQKIIFQVNKALGRARIHVLINLRKFSEFSPSLLNGLGQSARRLLNLFEYFSRTRSAKPVELKIWNNFIKTAWDSNNRSIRERIKEAILLDAERFFREHKFDKKSHNSTRSFEGRLTEEQVKTMMQSVRAGINEIEYLIGLMKVEDIKEIGSVDDQVALDKLRYDTSVEWFRKQEENKLKKAEQVRVQEDKEKSNVDWQQGISLVMSLFIQDLDQDLDDSTKKINFKFTDSQSSIYLDASGIDDKDIKDKINRIIKLKELIVFLKDNPEIIISYVAFSDQFSTDKPKNTVVIRFNKKEKALRILSQNYGLTIDQWRKCLQAARILIKAHIRFFISNTDVNHPNTKLARELMSFSDQYEFASGKGFKPQYIEMANYLELLMQEGKDDVRTRVVDFIENNSTYFYDPDKDKLYFKQQELPLMAKTATHLIYDANNDGIVRINRDRRMRYTPERFRLFNETAGLGSFPRIIESGTTRRGYSYLLVEKINGKTIKELSSSGALGEDVIREINNNLTSLFRNKTIVEFTMLKVMYGHIPKSQHRPYGGLIQAFFTDLDSIRKVNWSNQEMGDYFLEQYHKGEWGLVDPEHKIFGHIVALGNNPEQTKGKDTAMVTGQGDSEKFILFDGKLIAFEDWDLLTILRGAYDFETTATLEEWINFAINVKAQVGNLRDRRNVVIAIEGLLNGNKELPTQKKGNEGLKQYSLETILNLSLGNIDRSSLEKLSPEQDKWFVFNGYPGVIMIEYNKAQRIINKLKERNLIAWHGKTFATLLYYSFQGKNNILNSSSIQLLKEMELLKGKDLEFDEEVAAIIRACVSYVDRSQQEAIFQEKGIILTREEIQRVFNQRDPAQALHPGDIINDSAMVNGINSLPEPVGSSAVDIFIAKAKEVWGKIKLNQQADLSEIEQGLMSDDPNIRQSSVYWLGRIYMQQVKNKNATVNWQVLQKAYEQQKELSKEGKENPIFMGILIEAYGNLLAARIHERLDNRNGMYNAVMENLSRELSNKDRFVRELTLQTLGAILIEERIQGKEIDTSIIEGVLKHDVDKSVRNRAQNVLDQIAESEVDKDHAVISLKNEDLGGIDLNSANLILNIKRDGQGVLLPVTQQDIESIKLEGLTPIIMDIKPALSSFEFAQLIPSESNKLAKI